MKVNIKYLIFSEDEEDSVNFIVNLNVIRAMAIAVSAMLYINHLC